MRRPRVLISLVLLVGMLVSGAVPAAGSQSHPVIYAHRGGAGYAPENTLGAFRKTWDLFGSRGVWLEMDTQATKDGQLVVMHDDSVDRTTNCTGAVNALTLQQLSRCNAAAHYKGWTQAEKVPTLREVLTEGKAKGWKLMIEIKNIPLEANFNVTGDKVATLLVQLVRATGFPLDHLIVQSFFPTSLDNMRRLEPRVPRLFLSSDLPALVNAAYSTSTNVDITAPTAAKVTKQFIELSHRLGRRVITWTVDDPTLLHNLRAWFADGVITNRPDVAFATYR